MSPKERFLQLGKVAEIHRDIVLTEGFQRAVEASMLQVMSDLPMATTTEQAAANNYRQEGARLFASTLLSIGDAPLPRKPRSRGDNLGQHV